MVRNNCVKKEFFGLIASLIIMIGLITGCSAAENTPGTDIGIDDTFLGQEVSASGEVVPKHWVYLAYPNGAVDLVMKVNLGDQVSKNDVLVTSDNPQLLAALFQAQSALARAQSAYDQLNSSPTNAALASAKAVLANAEANYDRLDTQGASDVSLDAAQADIDAAKAGLEALQSRPSTADLTAAENDIRAAEWALKQAEEAFDLKAPFSGTIVEIYAKSGEAIGAAQPLMILADLSDLQVITTDLGEIDAARLTVGQSADILFDALPDRTLNGTVEKIAEKSSGTSSVYYEVTLTLNEIPANLRWGMTAYITFPVD